MNRIFRILISLVIVCGGYKQVISQKGAEAGIWIGAAHYFGDLNNLYRLNEPGLAIGTTLRYNFNTRLSARIQFNYFRLRAHDTKSSNAFDVRRNLNFFSDNFEAAPSLEFNFFTYRHGSDDAFITPYMFAGLSFFHFKPKTEYQNEIVSLRELGTEGQLPGSEYASISGAWLIGGGVKLDLSYRWSLNFDLGYRSSFTDYLDDVSTVYPNASELLSAHGPIAVELSDRSIPGLNNEKMGKPGFQRGDSNDKDAYVTFGVNLVYFFGRLPCPPISIPN
ncbi:MAG: DUF6089 family protein [Bacteroidota bacterium]|nr:DUF6089 family protein [Bacteroidota bacterium]